MATAKTQLLNGIIHVRNVSSSQESTRTATGKKLVGAIGHTHYIYRSMCLGKPSASRRLSGPKFAPEAAQRCQKLSLFERLSL